MLKNDYLDAKIGVDPAENEPRKECCVVAHRAADLHDVGDARDLRRAELEGQLPRSLKPLAYGCSNCFSNFW